MAGWIGKIIELVIILALIAIVSTMTIVAGAGSTTLAAILDAISDWSGLIALGIALGLFFYFMPATRKKF